MAPIEFKAPWSHSLKISTAVGMTLIIMLGAAALWMSARYGLIAQLIVIGMAILVLLTTLRLLVMGYTLTQDEIIVKQLGKTTRLRLGDLQAVDGKADAMQGAWRLLASQGVFSYSGWYWSKELRRFRAMASDPSRSVVLRFTNQTIVITPHDPQHFIVRARTLMKTMAHRA